ncbi:MAG: replication initiator [Cutibacterium avidum]|nr:replication initiator [Cutibacterium avidum]ERS23726.1 hypothetical protein HMPREF1301_01531 [Propionibacterium sp. KPL2005]ERS30408.1 hypothetical protein HMPREF1297_01240 [Propionibacterium sp. KPL2000]ERS40443.1 hypothetical protein HMPREF1271_00060 [Propionibacterium sp. KPL1838]ERS68850.1 hypothetical protein HMPREF1279_01222 [Propionibacterium sp. KPL1852]MCG7370747.1 hypothetical protein [Cutibacterium avidum]
MAAQLLDRVKDGTWDAFATAAAHVGHCAYPIRLSGSTTRIDAHTGEVLSVFRSADQPLGVLFQRCGNRRESVCPSCSRLYARDTFEVIRCGVQGGKNIPETVADNPLVFLTLTAPSFGAVHGTRGGKPCHPRREGQLCPHGRPQWCNARHDENDPLARDPPDHRRGEDLADRPRTAAPGPHQSAGPAGLGGQWPRGRPLLRVAAVAGARAHVRRTLPRQPVGLLRLVRAREADRHQPRHRGARAQEFRAARRAAPLHRGRARSRLRRLGAA